jgi:hypothetical protein
MTLPKLAAKALFLLQTSLALSAAVIYNGGGPNGVNGAGISNGVIAMQFTLANAANLQGLMFLGSANVNNVPSQFSGTIGFRFLTDNAGTPGTSLALGSDSSVRLIDNATRNAGTHEYQFLVNLGSIPLGAGTYWLALHEGTMGTPGDGTIIFWSTTSSAPLGTPVARVTSDLNGLTGYTNTVLNSPLAFQLLDAPAYNPIPEPSTWVLSLSAAAFLLLRRRR